MAKRKKRQEEFWSRKQHVIARTSPVSTFRDLTPEPSILVNAGVAADLWTPSPVNSASFHVICCFTTQQHIMESLIILRTGARHGTVRDLAAPASVPVTVAQLRVGPVPVWPPGQVLVTAPCGTCQRRHRCRWHWRRCRYLPDSSTR